MDLPHQPDRSTLGKATVDFEFRGTAAEYFRIWIVNVLLSMMTVGIYSAWAKVRRKKYFYRNTLLEGDAFDYHADPVKILKGRLIAVAGIAMYVAVGYLVPGVEFLVLLLIFILSPWLIVKARMFNARNSSYRNIRFTFKHNYAGAYKAYLGLPLLIPFTFALIFPFVRFVQNEFIIANSGFGRSAFTFQATPGKYYRIYFAAAGIFLLVWILVIFLLTGLGLNDNGAPGPADEPQTPETSLLLFYLSLIALALAYLVPYVYVTTQVHNTVFGNTSVARHRLHSNLRVHEMLGIYVTNILAIIFSLGLAIPWARIRTTRYRLEHLSLTIVGTLDEFTAAEKAEVSATGEEVGDFFDIDIGI